jgi:TatD DNase family protein
MPTGAPENDPRNSYKMIDSHVHLNRSEFQGEAAAVVARAHAAGITGFLNVGYDVISSRESITLAETIPGVLATVGVHPHDALLIADEDGNLTSPGREILNELKTLAAHPRVVAVGEIGLDYFRDLSPRPAQQTAMKLQMELAEELHLPVVFHIRDAWDEALALIDEVGVPAKKGVLHAFSGNQDNVLWAKDRGMLLGIGGPLTYKNSNLSQILEVADPAMVLLETDAPWLPPVPHRGKRNEPAYVAHTCERLAEVFNLTTEALIAATTENFLGVFGDPGREG